MVDIHTTLKWTGLRRTGCPPPLRAAAPVARPRAPVRFRRRAPAVIRAATTADADSPPYQVAARKDLYELRIYGGHYVCRAPYNNREKGPRRADELHRGG